MIKRLDITGVHMDVSDDLRKYVAKKIGHLDRFVPRASRQSMHADIKLKEINTKNKNERMCEVIMHLPHDIIIVKESTINMHAAIDIVETKLHHQLKRYKDLHTSPRLHQRMMARLKHRPLPS